MTDAAPGAASDSSGDGTESTSPQQAEVDVEAWEEAEAEGAPSDEGSGSGDEVVAALAEAEDISSDEVLVEDLAEEAPAPEPVIESTVDRDLFAIRRQRFEQSRFLEVLSWGLWEKLLLLKAQQITYCDKSSCTNAGSTCCYQGGARTQRPGNS